MKLRQSGMPEEQYWESLFDVPLILERLAIDRRLNDTVEIGCGYGTFTFEIAKRISGQLLALDIDSVMVERTKQRLAEHEITNAVARLRDAVLDGFGVPDGSQDGCFLFNILHGEEPIQLLGETRRILHDDGKVFVIHWRYEATTPRGPSMDIRPRPEQCLEWASQVGFRMVSDGFIDLPPYHWGMVLSR